MRQRRSSTPAFRKFNYAKKVRKHLPACWVLIALFTNLVLVAFDFAPAFAASPGAYSSNPAPGSVLDIGTTTVGLPINNSTLVVSNLGPTGTLTLSSFAIAGTNASDFRVVSPAPGTAINVGASQTITIQCTPSAVGTRNAILNINNDDIANSSPVYGLTCTGQAPVFSSVPPPGSTINFGSVTVGTTANLSIAVSNIGTGTLIVNGYGLGGSGDFGVPSPFPMAINAGSTKNINLTCTPSSAGPRTATVSLSTNDPAQPSPSYTLTCNGVTTPVFSATPPPPGPIVISSAIGVPSAPVNISVTNAGAPGTTLTVTVTAPAAPFVAGPPTLNILQGSPPQNIAVSCTPAVPSQTGTLTLTTNDPTQATVIYNLTCLGTQPGFSSTPPPPGPVNVGNVVVGQTGSTTVTVSETGNATLNVGNPVLGGTNPGDFGTTGLPISIADGGVAQTFNVTCTPTAPGPRTATLTITTNDPTQTSVTYNLACTGTQAGYGSTPPVGSTINVGSSSIGITIGGPLLSINETGTATLNVSNPVLAGANPGDFAVSGLPISIPDGSAAQSVTIKCTPTAAGPRTATLSLTTNDLAQPTVSYTLNCTGQAPIYGSAPVAPGGTINVGSSSIGIISTPAFNLTINNTGTGSLVVSNPALSGANAGEFSLSGITFPVTITPGGSATLGLQCTPAGAGLRVASLALTTNDPVQPTPGYTLNCTGLVPSYSSNPPIGAINVGTSLVGTPTSPVVNLVISNGGPGTLTVGANGTLITGANAGEFTLGGAALPLTIVSGGSATLTLQCTPAGIGPRTASLNLKSNDPANPTPTYSLSCTGQAPVYSSNPPVGPLNLGSSLIGVAGAPLSLNITNNGNLNLTVNLPGGGAITGPNAAEFALTGPFPLNLGPAASQAVSLKCTPAGAGTRTATLTFSTNDPTKPAPSYALSCTGLTPAGYNSSPVAPGGTIAVGSSPVGTPISFNLSVLNTGGTSLTVSLPGGGAITGANAADFSLTSPAFPFTIPAGGPSQNVTIQCNPLAVGTRTATLTFSTNDAAQPSPSYTLTCTGLLPGYASTPVAPGGTINLGGAALGGSVGFNLTVQNTGGASLTVSLPGGGAITGPNAADFSLTSPAFPFTLPGGGSQVVAIKCVPSGFGTRTATLTFNTTDSNKPAPSYTLTCIGYSSGYNSSPVAPGGTILVGSAKVGNSVSYKLTVSNSGASILTISSPTITGPNAADFSLVSPATFPFTVGSNGTQLLIIKCTPSAGGTRTATLTFNTTDPNLPVVSYNLMCTEPKNEPQPADLYLQLSVSPDRVAANNPENLIAYTFKVQNKGQGEAAYIRLTLPVDPNLVVGYTQFNAPGLWVTAITADAVIVSLPSLKFNDMVSGTIIFRPKANTDAGTRVTTRYTVRYDDPVAVDYHRQSNAVTFSFSADGDNQSANGVVLLSPASQSGRVGSKLTYTANFLAPDEFATAWVTKSDKTSFAINGGWANPKGELTLTVDTIGLPLGSYTLSILGNRSQATGNAALIITEAHLVPETASVKIGENPTFVADFLAAGELTSAWITNSEGKSSTLGMTRANDKGEFPVTINTKDFAVGTYTVVILGNNSQLSAHASLTITGPGNLIPASTDEKPLAVAQPVPSTEGLVSSGTDAPVSIVKTGGTTETKPVIKTGPITNGGNAATTVVAPAPAEGIGSVAKPGAPAPEAKGNGSGVVTKAEPVVANPVKVEPVVVNPGPATKADPTTNSTAGNTLVAGSADKAALAKLAPKASPKLVVTTPSIKVGSKLSFTVKSLGAGDLVSGTLSGGGKSISLVGATAGANGEVTITVDAGSLTAGSYTLSLQISNGATLGSAITVLV